MKRAWMIIKFVFYVLLALAMIVCLIMSFFNDPEGVPEFVWGAKVF